jgi:hypothetical protein
MQQTTIATTIKLFMGTSSKNFMLDAGMVLPPGTRGKSFEEPPGPFAGLRASPSRLRASRRRYKDISK